MTRQALSTFIILAILTLILTPGRAAAQIVGQTHCGLASPSGAVVATQYYDPFNPTPMSNQSATLTLSRYIGSQPGQKTQQVNFYFTQAAGTPPGFQLLYQGVNVLYTAGPGGLGVGAPALSSSNSAATGTIGYNFGANTDTFSPQVTLSVPAGLDLSNGLTVNFNIVYACNGTGSNFANVSPTSPESIANALILPVAVLDALQAYYAGPALDFGQVGQVTQAQIVASPSTYSRTGYLHVASSGPYTVTIKSTAANAYRMTYPGGSTATGGQYIPYKITLLGQTRSNTDPNFVTTSCSRAGIISGANIALTATLEDGGIGKVVGSYQDNLEVTITPLVNAPSPLPCG